MTNDYEQAIARLSTTRSVLGRGGARDRLDRPWDRCSTTPRAVLSLVRRRRTQHLLQRRRPARRAGRGEQPALIHDSAMTGTKRTLTLCEVRDETARLRRRARALGVGKGDRVIIYMPMVPEAAIAMLGLRAARRDPFGRVRRLRGERTGDPHRRCAAESDRGGQLRARAGPRSSHTSRCSTRRSSRRAHKPDACVISAAAELAAEMQRARRDWVEAIGSAEPHDCVPVAATDPLYILYTSGTTGQPKGIVRDNGGHAVALHWSMQAIYGVDAGDVFWAASDVGWVVGHSYIVYGPLLRGCTTVMFEGKPVGTPDAGAFWRVIASTASRRCSRRRPRSARSARGSRRRLAATMTLGIATQFVAGERCDPETLRMGAEKLGVPVIDHWWQTETGWAIAGNPGRPGAVRVRAGSAGKPMPGGTCSALDDNGHRSRRARPARSLPAAVAARHAADAVERRDAFVEAYLEAFPGYYETGDAGLHRRGRLRVRHESHR